MKSFKDFLTEVEGPRSELDKKVFAQHPIKTTDYPVTDNGVFTSKTKDKSRKADHSPEESKDVYSKENSIANPDVESPLYEPQTLGSRQKIMQYFKPESKEDNREPMKEDVDGTYRASFYGQLKRRLTKHIIPAKPATQKLTTKLDIDDPAYRRENGNEQGVIKPKEIGTKSLARQAVKTLLKKTVNEVSYDRLRRYMDKNDDEYNKETDKDNPYDGNTQKRERRSKGFTLATNKRIEKNVKVPARDE